MAKDSRKEDSKRGRRKERKGIRETKGRIDEGRPISGTQSKHWAEGGRERAGSSNNMKARTRQLKVRDTRESGPIRWFPLALVWAGVFAIRDPNPELV